MKTLTNTWPLLAKSTSPGGREITVAGHTRDVMDALAALFGGPGEPTPLAGEWCAFFGVADVDGMIRNARAAAFCHDWGKANDGFQRMLAHNKSQLLRHEQVSALLMCWPSVWRWLEGGGFDVPVVLSAVVGHHLKARDVEFGKVDCEPGAGLRLRWEDADLRQFLAATSPALGLSQDVPDDVPKLLDFRDDGSDGDLQRWIDAAADRLEALDKALRPQTPEVEARRRMLWAARAALVAADSAGSGLVRTGRNIGEWIDEAFDPAGRLTGALIEEKVIAPRLDGRPLRAFQEAAADPRQLPGRSLLLAPCGFGKTLAAWRWIAARLDERPRGRAIFLYPTRGTATEGYRDYAGLAGEGVAALMHGTADLDLDGIEADAPAERRINEARLFALRQWPKRLFSATVDQFLGFMQHGYAATCQLPLLADAVVVIDEVHSYDRGMWSALLEFLKCFPDVPVLCMTATLLNRRVKELEALGVTAVNGISLNGGHGTDLHAASVYPRYRVRLAEDQSAAAGAVEAALDCGERVLWVVNTVDRCQSIARQFAADPAADALETPDRLPVFCYHSRFKLDDRKTWHEAVIKAFKPGGEAGRTKRGVLAVTTQVCEMSLDLDADLLVTEECPATALVQRMGRCCRDPDAHESGRTGEVVIYKPEHMLPYSKQDMGGAGQVIDAMVHAGAVSQDRLAELLEGVSPAVELPRACRFTESGVWAAAGEEQFRDADDIGRPALLADDLDEYARLRDPRRRGGDPPWRADGLVMNVPKKLTQEHERPDLPPWLRLASGGVYRPALGYCGGEAPGAGGFIV